MRKASWAIALLVLVSTFHLAITIIPENARAATLYVGGTGPGNYTTIQDAINASSPGDIVFVYNGTYFENLLVNKTLSLVGEDAGNTTIDSSMTGDVIYISADWVNITGFTVMNTGQVLWGDAGIEINSASNCNISGNVVKNDTAGIKLWQSSFNIIIGNNVSDNRQAIISEHSPDNIIAHNLISNSSQAGIHLVLSNNGTIVNNTISQSNWASILVVMSKNVRVADNIMSSINSLGISFQGTNSSTISNNEITWNYEDGIEIYESYGNDIRGNTVRDNRQGLRFTHSGNNTVTDNNISDNSGFGIRIFESHSNSFKDNFLSDNDLAFYIIRSTNQIILNNTMTDSGILLIGEPLEDWNSHVIDINNTINGKPVIYWKNVTGGTLPSGAAQVILANCSGVTVENQDIKSWAFGASVAYSRDSRIINSTFPASEQVGILILFSENITVSENNISTNYSIESDYSSHINIDSNRFLSSYGLIGVFDAREVNFTNNFVLLNRVELLTIQVFNLTVTDNYGPGGLKHYADDVTLGDISNNNLSIGLSVVVWYSERLVYSENPLMRYFSLYGSSNCSVVDNTIFQTGGYGIVLEGVFNSEIIGNIISENDYGIRAASTADNVIANNTISQNIIGIYLNRSGTTRVENNTLFMHSDSDILLEQSQNNTIVRNNASSVSTYGIRLHDSDDNILSYNAVSNGVFGISFFRSHRSHVDNNTVEYTRYGISSSSDYGTFVNNTISNNDDGIEFPISSDFNMVYHNNFMDNLVQAEDTSDNNIWDNGYPSGGNYWSDYSGVDVRTGPNQDIVGSDGIGDIPYVVSASASDRYPLTSPFAMIHPLPPAILSANLSGLKSENVTLRWILSPDDGQGQVSIGGYEIYRGGSYDSDGVGYSLIASLPNGTSEFIDLLAGEGDPDNYYYRVCAIDASGNTTCSMNQAGKFTRQLSEGVNLLSVPLVQSNESLETVFQTMSFDKAWSYDSVNSEWRSFVMSKPLLGDLAIVDHAIGFWVNLTADSNLTVAGIVPVFTDIPLYKGWNLVGFPSVNTSHSVSELKVQTGAIDVEAFDSSSSPYFLREMLDAESLEAGGSYWIWVNTDTTWAVSGS